jgi:hypothetical protein
MANPNIVLGSGKVYFDLLTGGLSTGERYLAQTPGFSISAVSEGLDYEDVDTKIAEVLFSLTTKITRTARLEVRDMSDENYSLFVLGTTSTLTQTSGAVANEVIANVQQGRYYQIGATLSNPTGVRNISAVTVTGPTATPTYTVTTDYTVDLALGRLYIVPGGAITAASNLEVDYTKAAATRVQVASNSIAENYGALRFVADNSIGANRDMYAPYVLLKPSGDLAMKSRTDYQVATFDVAFQRKEGYSQLYIDGRAV